MAYTLIEASKACGINRSTVLRALKSGRLSGSKDDAGAWRIEPVELHRIFLPRACDEATPQVAQPESELVALLKAQLADALGQRDAWQRMAEAKLLPVQTVPAPGQSWWRRLRSSG